MFFSKRTQKFGISMMKLGFIIYMFFAVQNAFSQGVSVSGTVTDATGEPLPGVSVVVSDTSSGTTTDINGRYLINAAGDNSVLQFTFVGYITQRLVVGSQRVIDVAMQEDISQFDELVVVGYGVQRRINLSGAVDAIDSRTLDSRPVLNVGQALQGVSPNLNVHISQGRADVNPTFNVRGFTSVNGGGPLILVDNIPTGEAELARLNPNDIENISVLKDAASAAIYGARAGFGVVLITTKTGRSDKVSVNVNANYAYRTLARFPDIVMDPLTNFQIKNEAGRPTYAEIYNQAEMEMARLASAGLLDSPYQISPRNPDHWFYVGQTDWYKEAMENAGMYSINADVSQKGERSSYFLSVGHVSQDGILRYGKDFYNRYNMRGKVDFQITDWLKVGNNTTFGNTEYDGPSFGGIDAFQGLLYMEDFWYQLNHLDPTLMVKNPDGSWTSDIRHSRRAGRLFALAEEGGRRVVNSRDIMTSFFVDIDIIKDVWKIKADATFRRNSQLHRESRLRTWRRHGPNLPLEPFQVAGVFPGAYNQSAFDFYDVYNIYTDFQKTFSEKHFVNAMVGFNQESSRYNTISITRPDLVNNNYPTVQLATGAPVVTEDITTWAVRGAFIRLNYIYDNRYIAEFNGRYDGTSRFPQKNRFGFFPSGSVAWVISNESFMEGIKDAIGMDMLKFRGSYGNLGNQNVGAYSYIDQMTASASNMLLDLSFPMRIAAPGLVAGGSLTWEKVSTINGGMDVYMFRNRLTMSLDIYTRYTTGMLTQGRTLPNVLGTAEPRENAADLKTQGWDWSISWRDRFSVAGSPMHYFLRFTFADSRAHITKFDNPNRVLTDFYEGQELGEIWGLTTLGFFKDDADVANSPSQTAVGSGTHGRQFYPGDLKFADINNRGVIDRGEETVDNPGALKIIGNNRARLLYSFDLSADWNGFDVRAFFQGVGKRDWYPSGDDKYAFGIYCAPWAFIQTNQMDHWTPDNPDAYWPRIKAYIARTSQHFASGYHRGSEDMSQPQTKYLQNAAYLRLQNLQVGYTIPQSLTQTLAIERFRVFFSAENVFETSNMRSNVNPATADVRPNIYPLQRTWSLGLNLSF